MAVRPPRPWIPAQQSFDSQPGVLRTMARHLAQRLVGDGVPAVPERVAVCGIGASHAAAGSAVFDMRRRGLDAVRLSAADVPDGQQIPADVVIGVSQSGRSAETVDLMSRIAPARRMAVVNYTPSPLGDIVERTLDLGDVPDSSVSFVSFTGTVVALGMLAEAWTTGVELQRWLDAVDAAETVVAQGAATIRDFASRAARAGAVDFVASAGLISAAEEGALMMREGARKPATAMETRQYLHGPMDCAGSSTAHVVVGGARERRLVEQLAERTSNLLLLVPAGEAHPAVDADVIDVPVPNGDAVAFVIVATMLAQELTLATSLEAGVDVDEAVFTRLDTKVDRAGAR